MLEFYQNFREFFYGLSTKELAVCAISVFILLFLFLTVILNFKLSFFRLHSLKRIAYFLFIITVGLILYPIHVKGHQLSIYFGIATVVMYYYSLVRRSFQIGRYSYTDDDCMRGWFVCGQTGSGKTASGLMYIMHQFFKNYLNMGGMCLDQKGNFHKVMAGVMQHYDIEERLVTLEVRPDNAPQDWKPKRTYNIISYPGIPPSAYAAIIVDTATAQEGSGGTPFFKTTSQNAIAEGITFLQFIGYPATLSNTHAILTNPKVLQDLINEAKETEQLTERLKSNIIALESFLNQPPDQRGGVIGTIDTYLRPFTHPEIIEVFCPDENSVELEEMDNGYMFCISLPQRFVNERNYINTIMKLLYYTHVLRRFDYPTTIKHKNLLTLWADEAQGLITASDKGMADYNILDKIREARGTAIFATQSTKALLPVLKKDKTDVLLVNLANKLIFRSAHPEDAKLSAEIIGKHTITKRSHGYSGGKRNANFQQVDEYQIKPEVLSQFKQFECIVLHCNKGYYRTKLAPLASNGKIAWWYGWRGVVSRFVIYPTVSVVRFLCKFTQKDNLQLEEEGI